jgi:hypothetical protein
MTSRQDDPAEQLLDVLVYAPLGLLLEARDLLPKLADKGRQRLGGQVTVARMVGELAVRQGQRRAEKVIERLREQNSAGAGANRGQARRPEPANGHAGEPADRDPSGAATVTDIRPPAAPAPDPEPRAGGGASALAIPGYDTLSASQVVPRLEGLSADELEAVRVYEQTTRARKTVLTRIDQLRGKL